MEATVVRSTDAPPFISPLEENVAFSVDLTQALGSNTLTGASLVSAKSRYSNQGDTEGSGYNAFVVNVVPSGTSVTIVCGDGAQVEGTEVDVTIQLTLAGVPPPRWTLYVTLPVARKAPS